MHNLILRYLQPTWAPVGDSGAPDTSATPGTLPDSFSSIDQALAHYKEDDERDPNDVPADVEHAGDEYDPTDFGAEPGDDGETDLEATAADQEDQDPAEQPRPGTFAAHTQQVKLPDGSTTTVAQLLQDKQGHGDLGQREQSFQADVEQFTRVRGAVQQMHHQMQQDRQLLAGIAQALMPQDPDVSLLQTDPTSYHILLNASNKAKEMIRQVAAQYAQAQQQEQEIGGTDLEGFQAAENRKLLTKDKRFGDRKYWEGFWKDAFKYGPQAYGYTADELAQGMRDHRQFLVLRDALAYRRSQAKLKEQHTQARRQPSGQPAPQRVISKSGRQGNPQQLKAQQARAAFNKAPSLKTAMALDL